MNILMSIAIWLTTLFGLPNASGGMRGQLSGRSQQSPVHGEQVLLRCICNAVSERCADHVNTESEY